MLRSGLNPAIIFIYITTGRRLTRILLVGRFGAPMVLNGISWRGRNSAIMMMVFPMTSILRFVWGSMGALLVPGIMFQT